MGVGQGQNWGCSAKGGKKIGEVKHKNTFMHQEKKYINLHIPAT
jgi:hypothetical protein